MSATEPKLEQSNNAENFSLSEFFDLSGNTLNERVQSFSDYYRESQKLGLALYSREIVGAPGREVQVKNPLTGEVRPMLMFGSNDYLGFSHNETIKKAAQDCIQYFGVGMGGPPLLNGMNSIHRSLEKEIAKFKTKDDAMIFASGFQANIGWVTALLRSQDVIIYDELSHASFYDGLKLARYNGKVKAIRFKHNDMVDLEKNLSEVKKTRSGVIFVTVEGVYSMDGDIAPLDKITELCQKYGAILVVDDAHGTGVMGKSGRGTAEHFGVEDKVDLTLGTFSKSFSVTGGFLTGKQEVIDYLRFFARSYIFSAHLPQSIAAAVLAGLKIMQENPSVVKNLHSNAQYLRNRLKEIGFDIRSETPIIPIRIPQHVNIRQLAYDLDQEGLFVNSIEYPAVSLSEQRIRLSVMSTHTLTDLETCARIFERLNQKYNLTRE